MLKIWPKNIRHLLQAARGQAESDLVLSNARIVNVFTGEILPGDVYVCDGFIAHVEYAHPGQIDAPVKQVVNCQGQYVIPGLIDAHMHIESTMLTPRNFCKAVLPKGTTTVITDPHEIGNVFGVEGVRYMHEASEDLPMRQLIDIPSCVPSVPGKECAGAAFGAAEVEELASLERVVGLAEIMDYPGVIRGDERMLSEIETAVAHGLYLQGHAPMLSGRDLSAYLCAGPISDHESSQAAEGLEKFRQGLRIDLNESSICHYAKNLLTGLKGSRYLDTLNICTDDRESADLLRVGHINDVLRICIANGMDPVDAVKCATINNAREIHLDRLGAVAPGYAADLCVLPDLKEMNMHQVYYAGQLVAEDDQLVVEIPEKHFALEDRDSLNFRTLKREDFLLRAPMENGKIRIQYVDYQKPDSSYTVCASRDVEVRDGVVQLPDSSFQYAAVVNRYGADHIFVALVHGIGIREGALASTVSHDSHNLTLVYDTPDNALLAANTLKACHGGMTAVRDGQVLAVLPLPIAGLLSKEDAEHTAIATDQLKEANRSLGLTRIPNPLLRIAVLALPVVPEIKLSDLGMVDVASQEFVPVFPEN